jgi:hypothetical protein
MPCQRSIAEASSRGHERRAVAPAGAEMSESETPQSPASNGVVAFPNPVRPASVTFDRRELGELLNLYGRMVAAGEWRDYAIDFLKDKAQFSVYRRSSEVPLYRIVKDPALAKRQGAYSVVAATGLVLKRGTELSRVLRVLDKRLSVVS